MSVNFIDSFSEFKEMKNMDRPTMIRVLEDVFRTLIKKKYGSDEQFDVIVNQKGDLELWRVRNIVPDGEVEDENSQISVSEARQVQSDYEVGEDCYQALFLEEFGRRAVMAARQTLISRVVELQKDEIYKKYQDRIGEIVSGEVHQVLKREILLLDDISGNELLLPKSDMIKGDHYRKGDMVRCVIKRVDLRNNTPLIIVSRTDNSFLEKLLEQEVPEIEDGLITIRQIVRQPGERAKVAVESYDDRIDPVGACVGMKGSRIHGIVRELRNENIDIINYSSNTLLMIQRALTPAKVSKIDIVSNTETNKKVNVFLDQDQVSLAIGRGGQNIKLASKLTGFEIDVFREDSVYEEEDIDLDEFTDEIEEWIIEELKSIGCDTAKSVIRLSVEELVRRTDLEEETVLDVKKILEAEFEG